MLPTLAWLNERIVAVCAADLVANPWVGVAVNVFATGWIAFREARSPTIEFDGQIYRVKSVRSTSRKCALRMQGILTMHFANGKYCCTGGNV
jgi:hypothetical protein